MYADAATRMSIASMPMDLARDWGTARRAWATAATRVPKCPRHTLARPRLAARLATGRAITSTRGSSRTASSNVRRLGPGDIPLDHGIPLGDRWTHLYYAFGTINPTTFKIVDDPSKRSLYREFTDLRYRPNGPQTWIAVGGFDFSDPGVDPDAETDDDAGQSTHSTWSDMAMTADRRATFISSVMAFMD
ncbi:hypothetical protein SBRCBS47491_009086 [Sporothrix bragantina]|uniref:GH18 domain-containing protein n=1 Tax=Sporothrix bragantina TaxID=671064 RepID=A0ABP0CTD1_9PEZI